VKKIRAGCLPVASTSSITSLLNRTLSALAMPSAGMAAACAARSACTAPAACTAAAACTARTQDVELWLSQQCEQRHQVVILSR
jgi:hypothetical protein